MVDQTSTEPPQYDWQTPKPQFDVGRVLANAFKGLFANIPALTISLLIVVVLNLITTLISNGTLASAVSPETIQTGTFGAAYWIAMLFIYIVMLVSFTWFQLVIVQTTYNQIFDVSNEVSDVMMKALKLCLPMAFLAVLYSIVCVIGFYALFIGFLFVWPGWALIGPVLMYEKETSYFGSFGRAWGLARRYKRWIFLILLIISIIATVVFSVTYSMMYPLLNYNILDPETATNLTQLSWRMVLFTLISSIGGYFIYGLYASAITASYAELKTIKGETGEHIASVFD